MVGAPLSMSRWNRSRLAPFVLGTGVLASAIALAYRVWPGAAAARAAFPALLALAIGAAAAMRVSGAPPGSRPVRVDLAFVLCALVLLPSPAATLIAMAAAASAAVAPPAVLRPKEAAVAIASVLLVDVGFRASGIAAAPGTPRLIAILAGLYAALYAGSFAWGWVMDRAAGSLEAPVPDPRRFFGESLNLLLAWLLIGELASGAWTSFLSLTVLVVLLGALLAKVESLDRHLRETHDDLDARIGELATLHAIGREVPSTLDPLRVCATVERECRKILDVGDLAIAMLDRGSRRMELVHPADRESRARPAARIGERLAGWVASHKRGIRIDELARSPLFPGAASDASGPRAAMAVPLVVEDQVVGALVVVSPHAEAYDEHGLALLSTIGQQAAVALENARHHALASVDSLTGLFLRDAFFRRLEEEHARASRYGTAFGLLMIDLDDFKEINDRHGHLAGDRFLGAFGEALRSRLRGADLACRYGGDEFCILLPETDLEASARIAERLRADIAALVVDIDGFALRTTVSIGIAAFPGHDSGDPKGLLLRADQALYQAKRAGRDRVVPYAG